MLSLVAVFESFARRGSGAEKQLYADLRRAGVPKNQVFRNVYVPTYGGKFTEIDVLVLSKKGFLVFEYKNYNGRVYGDGRATRWHKYTGGKKYDFLNPQIQNAGHIKYLLKYFGRSGFSSGFSFNSERIPAVSFVMFSEGAELHLKNVRKDVYILQKPGDFMKVYRKLPNNPAMARRFYSIMAELKKMSRAGRKTRVRHIADVRGMRNKVR